jgi:hypothetical protein
MIRAAVILAAALTALPAMAQTITFTISADGSGSLNGTAFSSKAITFTQVTTIADITTCSGYACSPDVDTNTVTIGGVGTETLNGGSYFFANGMNLIGITNEVDAAFLAADEGTSAPTI